MSGYGGRYIQERLINHHAYDTIPFAAFSYPIIEKLSGAFCDLAVFGKTWLLLSYHDGCNFRGNP
jgi:hypothetical protein